MASPFTFISSELCEQLTPLTGVFFRMLKECRASGLSSGGPELDELPQLFNILRGDMSFVGPRPLLPKDQPKEFGARLLVRPGLTGWAQVVGGREITPEDKAVLDVWYVRNAGLLLDLKVVARTIPIVLFGERISRSLIDRAWQDLTDLGIAKAEFTPGIGNSLHLAKSEL